MDQVNVNITEWTDEMEQQWQQERQEQQERQFDELSEISERLRQRVTADGQSIDNIAQNLADVRQQARQAGRELVVAEVSADLPFVHAVPAECTECIDDVFGMVALGVKFVLGAVWSGLTGVAHCLQLL